jgi:sugar-specific transcriptional regulator TrmB
MGFFDKVGGNKALLNNEEVVHVNLTELGEEKLKSLEPKGTEFDIVSGIKKCQPCTAKEVSSCTNMPSNKVFHFFMMLKEKGWIAQV